MQSKVSLCPMLHAGKFTDCTPVHVTKQRNKKLDSSLEVFLVYNLHYQKNENRNNISPELL